MRPKCLGFHDYFPDSCVSDYVALDGTQCTVLLIGLCSATINCGVFTSEGPGGSMGILIQREQREEGWSEGKNALFP